MAESESPPQPEIKGPFKTIRRAVRSIQTKRRDYQQNKRASIELMDAAHRVRMQDNQTTRARETTAMADSQEAQLENIDTLGAIDHISIRLDHFIKNARQQFEHEEIMDTMETPSAPDAVDLSQLSTGLMDYDEDTPPNEKAQRVMAQDFLTVVSTSDKDGKKAVEWIIHRTPDELTFLEDAVVNKNVPMRQAVIDTMRVNPAFADQAEAYIDRLKKEGYTIGDY